MLYSLIEFMGEKVQGKDGEAGKLVDFLFDVETWVCRYLVVDTGGWLTPNEITLPMMCLIDPSLTSDENTLKVGLTRKQIEKSPKIYEKEPVSRQYERELARHYAVPHYWEGNGLWGGSPTPAIPVGWVPRENEDPSDIDSDSEDPQENHLRSVREVLGYSAHTDDGDIGKVVDLLVGSTAWQIRRLILDLNTWLPGGLVEIQSEEILDVSWEEQHFVLPIEKSEIRSRSEYDRKLAVNVDE